MTCLWLFNGLPYTQTNSVAFSPQANYTDWETATCRRNVVPTFVDRGVSRCQHGGSPTVVNLSFLDWSRYFSFKSLLIYRHNGWMDQVSDILLLRISGSDGNRTRDLWVCSQEVWLIDHRSGITVRTRFPNRSRLSSSGKQEQQIVGTRCRNFKIIADLKIMQKMTI
jgi:hypothetical protein